MDSLSQVFFLSLNLLLAAMMKPKLSDVEHDNFKVYLLKMIQWKVFSVILKNNSGRFLTWREKGGVNQIISNFLVGLFPTCLFLNEFIVKL